MQVSWKVVLVFVGIFAAGLVTGGALGLRWARKPSSNNRGNQRPSVEQFGRNHMEFLDQRLDLTDEQKAVLQPIIQKASDELRQIQSQTFKQSNEIFERLNAEIASKLTPGQKVKFEEIRRFQKERMRSFIQSGPRREGGKNREERNNMPPPPPPPPDGNKGP